MKAAAGWKRRRNRLAREVRRVVVAVLALVTVVGIMRAGAAYIYCAGMDEVVDEACCELHVHGRADGEPQIASLHDCCSVERFGAVPEGAVVARVLVPSATLTAVQQAPVALDVRWLVSRVPARVETPDAGPPKPSDIARRLRVFLI